MKKVVGIISIVLFAFVSLQSCAAGLGNSLKGSSEVSGSAGLMLAICWLIGGIVLLASGKNKKVVITAIVFYIIGGLLGIANVGSYGDLKIWSILSFVFAGLIIFHLYKNKDIYSNTPKNLDGKA